MTLIESKKVTKVYKLGMTTVHALRGVSSQIEKGDFIVIVGPSGSGKSTLMHILGALDKPSEGEVLIDGKKISKLDEWELAMIRRKKIGFIFQTFNLIPTLNALENVLIPTEPLDGEQEDYRERGENLLDLVGLKERMHHKPSELSGGERQRVAIARALINDPEIVFADEPTGNLDSLTGDKIINLMLNLNKEEKKTFVIVTHNQDLLKIASKKFIMKDGELSKIDRNHRVRKFTEKRTK